jgi:hypothetical protein
VATVGKISGGVILRRTIALVVAAVVLAGAAAVYLLRGSDDGVDSTPGATPGATPSATPTRETGPEPTGSASGPDDATASPGSSPTAPGGETATPTPEPDETPDDGRAAADVTLTYVAWNEDTGSVEASGYAVPLEEDGTCRLTLTGAGGRTASAEVDALPDVSSVACGGLQISGDELSSGLWRATLTYESATASGTSAAREVNVP